jgi:hypothetical protein
MKVKIHSFLKPVLDDGDQSAACSFLISFSRKILLVDEPRAGSDNDFLQKRESGLHNNCHFSRFVFSLFTERRQ